MLLYVIKRLFALIPVSVGVILFVGYSIHLIPGDPVDRILGDYASADEKSVLRSQLGLDQPIPLQLWDYVKRVSHGDLGTSLVYGDRVQDLILERMAPTVELALAAILLALLLSLPLGALSAWFRGRLFDRASMLIALLGVAIPNFWLGPMLILLFSVHLGWLPVSERAGFDSYLLPVFTLGTALAAYLSRITRTSFLEQLNENYVRTALAKGLSSFSVVKDHVLRNASIPIVTVAGLQFGVLLTGAVVTEKIFDWPGLGTLMLEGLGNRDYPTVQGCVLLFSMSYLLVNLMVDLVVSLIDPRVGAKL